MQASALCFMEGFTAPQVEATDKDWETFVATPME
jgi:hypothetical protein